MNASTIPKIFNYKAFLGNMLYGKVQCVFKMLVFVTSKPFSKL